MHQYKFILFYLLLASTLCSAQPVASYESWFDRHQSHRQSLVGDWDADGQNDIIFRTFDITSFWRKQITPDSFSASISLGDDPVLITSVANIDGIIGDELIEERDSIFRFYVADQNLKMALHSETTIDPELEPVNRVITDIDGDGDIDIFFAHRSSASYPQGFYVMHNDGTGVLAEPMLVHEVTQFYADHWVRDIDLDNDMDILLLSGNSLYTLEQISTDSFVLKGQPKELPDYKFPICIEDLDEDGQLDIVIRTKVGPFESQLVYIKNLGINSMEQTPISEPELYSAVNNSEVQFRDINWDDILDIFYISECRTKNKTHLCMKYFIGLGNGLFTTIQEHPLFELPSRIKEIMPYAEQRDLMIGQSNEQVLLHTVPENINIRKLDTLNFDRIKRLELHDLNNDGERKLVFYANHGIHWLSYPIDTKQTANNLTTFHYIDDNYVFTDIDDDSDEDIICETMDDRILILENRGENQFTMKAMFPAENSSHLIVDLSVTDINGDGHSDIACVITLGYEKVVFFENDGQGNFTYQDSFSFQNEGDYRYFMFDDMDNDLDADLILYNEEGDHFALYQNLGNTTFDSALRIETGNTIQRVNLVDVNNDGLLDFIFATGTPFDADVYTSINDGSFTFNSPQVEYNGLYFITQYFGVADINDDGFPDVLARNLSGQSILLLNQQDGTFSEPQVVTGTAFELEEFTTADIDYDGDSDVIILDNFSNSLITLEQTNPGSFERHEVGHDLLDAKLGFLIDDNDDGDIDITTSHVWGIGIFENLFDMVNINQSVFLQSPMFRLLNNPTREFIQLSASSPHQEINVQLIDVDGKVIHHAIHDNIQPGDLIQIPIETTNACLILIENTSTGERQIEKIIVTQ